MNFLVYEGTEMYQGEHRSNGRNIPASTTIEFNTVPFIVSADNENGAALSVARKTRRLSQYAIVPVTLLDFTDALGFDPPQPEPGRLLDAALEQEPQN